LLPRIIFSTSSFACWKETRKWFLYQIILYIKFHPSASKSQDSVVGIATGYGLDNRGVAVPVGQEFSLLHVVQTGSGVHPTSIKLVPGALSPVVRQLGCEADHSPPASPEVKAMWISPLCHMPFSA
jgi:hypothetical protein